VGRKIIHVDMDAFYASVEQRDDPRLRGRPVVVGGSPRSRGVVAAASYEARRFGIRSAMPCSQAARLCAHAVFVPPDFARYKEASRRVHEIFRRYTDDVEPLSLDEAYLDVTANHKNNPSATWIAEEIRAAIRAETQLCASAGVAPNKFLAKIASDVNKPDGLCVVRPEQVEEFLRDLPVTRLPGVGPVTARRFEELGVRRVPDILRLGEAGLASHFGRSTGYYLALANGEDPRRVESHRTRKSVSIEDTFEQDLVSGDEIRRRVASLAVELEGRLQRSGFRGRTVTIKVKYHDFRQITRSRSLPRSVTSAVELQAVADELLATTAVGEVAVRLVGVSVSLVERRDGEQLELPFGGEPA